MNKIVELKHWQVFISLTIFMFLSMLAASGNIHFGRITPLALKTIFGIAGLFVISLWLLVIGLSLNTINENSYHFRNGLLIFSVFYFFFGYSALHLLPNFWGIFPTFTRYIIIQKTVVCDTI